MDLMVSYHRRMKSARSSTPDIISDLPGNLIENILTCLPLRDAVRTSILSSKWRYKWVTLPQLVFDNLFSQELLENRPSVKRHKLVTTVYQVLLLHKGPILKFTLAVPELESCSDINHWILFLSKIDIQEFTLRIVGKHHKLPSHIFSFLQLRHLILRACVFKPPPTFRGFSKLVSLEFQNIVFAPEIFGKFISNCPLLEQLTLSGCTGFDCLEISAPRLKFLFFSGVFKSICFKNTPHLAEVYIALFGTSDYAEHLEEGETPNLIKVFCCLPAIENLCVDFNFLEFLAAGGVQKRLPSTLNHLKILDLSDMKFEKMDEVSCALCLITSSPNLQKLKIVAFTNTHAVMEHVVEFLRAQDFSDCSLNRLRKVKMHMISGVGPELEFIKFLLAYSTVLEKLKILPSGEKVDDGGFKMLKELTRFCRASPKAEIVYLDPDGH